MPSSSVIESRPDFVSQELISKVGGPAVVVVSMLSISSTTVPTSAVPYELLVIVDSITSRNSSTLSASKSSSYAASVETIGFTSSMITASSTGSGKVSILSSSSSKKRDGSSSSTSTMTISRSMFIVTWFREM